MNLHRHPRFQENLSQVASHGPHGPHGRHGPRGRHGPHASHGRHGPHWGLGVACFASCLGLLGCVSVKTEHRVEPIQITMDVNVRLERELEASFGDLDARSREIAKQLEEKGTD